MADPFDYFVGLARFEDTGEGEGGGVKILWEGAVYLCRSIPGDLDIADEDAERLVARANRAIAECARRLQGFRIVGGNVDRRQLKIIS